MEVWAAKKSIKLELIKLGSPYQNGFVERFNCSYREQVLVYICLSHFGRFVTLQING
ncbi:integrase core domain-containing protein [Pseudoalteromonas luteoviolacea]|uniref:integrase core domain-containing protein n=1 Tax=Pseudoalteromonas luteoviolacea TaxID=43657 RepID=UPI003AF90031